MGKSELLALIYLGFLREDFFKFFQIAVRKLIIKDKFPCIVIFNGKTVVLFDSNNAHNLVICGNGRIMSVLRVIIDYIRYKKFYVIFCHAEQIFELFKVVIIFFGFGYTVLRKKFIKQFIKAVKSLNFIGGIKEDNICPVVVGYTVPFFNKYLKTAHIVNGGNALMIHPQKITAEGKAQPCQ